MMNKRDFQAKQKWNYFFVIIVFIFLINVGYAEDKEKNIIGHKVKIHSTILKPDVNGVLFGKV